MFFQRGVAKFFVTFLRVARGMAYAFMVQSGNDRTAGIKKRVKGLFDFMSNPFTQYIHFLSSTDKCRDSLESPTPHCPRERR